ncbi:MAG: MarR family winged helix-turn-helix transcriptional regulator [Candidatus Cohnella colombiensis]|uniref:MarR family winged helix-turn-helix transcriptional regulator n=1 Tax=Candidatus Cohnella colombiensis TaxID=3121368 RepID=A0AA95EVH9_9BACL|nr:MAG: MarR family winged helix-turn-helix transcriptional regulator [Cohnella sp.]
MAKEIQYLGIIDLISDHYVHLRRMIEELWNEQSDLSISNSEWYIMGRIYQNQPTIASVSKHVEMSRQATHKWIKTLEAKGLVVVQQVENNKKVRCLQLTGYGEACYEKYMDIKSALEKRIEAQIGSEQVTNISTILKLNWGI